MEELKIDVGKALDAGIEYRDGVAQVNMDGSPITDKRYIRLAGDRFGILYNCGKIKEVDHQPTPGELRLANLGVKGDSAKKSAETRRKRKTAQESLEFLLECAANPKEAREVIRAVTGGEMSDTLKNFFCPPEGEENNLTQMDLVNLGQLAAAKQGDTKAAVYIRDTVGDKLADKQEISATFTDGDRSLLEKVSARIQGTE